MPAPKYLLTQRLAIAIALQSLDAVLDQNLIASTWFMGPNQSWHLEFTNAARDAWIQIPMTEEEIEKFDQDADVRKAIEARTREKILAALA